MSSAADPAAAHREPPRTFHRAFSAGTLGAAAVSTLALAVMVGASPITPVTTVTIAVGFATLLLTVGGTWALGEHRARVAEHAAQHQREAFEEWIGPQLEALGEQVNGIGAGVAERVMADLGDDIGQALRQAYAAGFVDCASGAPQPHFMASVTRLEPR